MKDVLNTLSNKPIKWAIYILYFLFLFSSGIYSYEKQIYNWDMLPYMGLVIGMENKNPDSVHDMVCNVAKRDIPAQYYNLLTDTSHQFTRQMAQSSRDFNDHLAICAVKPLYVWLVYLFYKAGVSLSKATVLPSVIACFFIGILLFSWLVKYVNTPAAFVSSIGVMLTAPMFNIAKLSTPDALSAFFLLIAMYFAIEKRTVLPVFIFLLLSVFTRLDNIIASFFIVTLLTFSDHLKMKISVLRYTIMLLILVGAYFLIANMGVHFGWNIFYYPTFLQHVNSHSGIANTFSFSEYWLLAYSQLRTGLFYSNIVTYLTLATFIFIGKNEKRRANFSFDQSIIVVVFIIILIKFILLPEIEDRFNIAWYILIIILLVRKISDKVNVLSKENTSD